MRMRLTFEGTLRLVRYSHINAHAQQVEKRAQPSLVDQVAVAAESAATIEPSFRDVAPLMSDAVALIVTYV